MAELYDSTKRHLSIALANDDDAESALASLVKAIGDELVGIRNAWPGSDTSLSQDFKRSVSAAEQSIIDRDRPRARVLLGQAIAYELAEIRDRADGNFGSGGSGSSTLSGLNDTTISGPATSDILQYNGSAWVDRTLAEAGIAAASHTHTESDITDLAHTTALSALTDDVTISGPSSSDILQWSGAAWVDRTLAEAGIAAASHTHTESDITDLAHTTALSALTTDVTISGPSSSDILQWSGAAWVDRTLAEAGIAAASHTHVEADITDLAHIVDVDDLSDVDTTTSAPTLNDVLKWDGSNWVPGTAGDTTEFTFSIDSFSDGISDTSQLIGSGQWQAIGAITFTATYSNAPGGMTAEVAMSGSATAWAGNLSMTPVTGPETNTEAVDYPSSTGGTITFTLSQSADASTDIESVTFNNTMRYGTNALTQGNQTEASLEALSEVAGPNESRSQTISNIPTGTAGHYLTFAYADRLSDVAQVRGNAGNGYITASFAAAATTLAPDIQTGVTAVDNSAGYSETFACLTSRLSDMTNGTNDFQLMTSSTAQNYIIGGGNTESTPSNYTESDIETGLTDQWVSATNDHTQTWPTVTLLASEHYVIAIPSRLGTPLFYDNDTGFEASFQSPATLAITNEFGYQENYNIFVSTNPLGPGDFTLRTE